MSFDASNFFRIDTTIFQTIATLRLKLRSENMDLNIIEHSIEFIDSAELLGIKGF